MKLWVGTSGYTYKHWAQGVFYPPGLQSDRWFDHYQQNFKTVELNVTFYRLPASGTFRDWRNKSAPDFKFFVKGSRFITHMKRLKDPEESLKLFFTRVLLLKDRLAGTLWQLPPSLRIDLDRLGGFLAALKKFPDHPTVFEFRHPSWFTNDTTALLKKAGAAYCRADLPAFYKELEIPDTAPFVYIRRHGPNAALKHLLNYSDKALEKDAEEIRSWLRAGKEVFIYFNNDGGGAAVQDAKKLEALLRVKRTQKEVIYGF